MAVPTERWKVRRAAARLLGDLLTLTATEDAPNGNPALFKDARNLSVDSSRTVNWQGVVVRSTAPENLWFRTRLESSSRATETATLDPPLPTWTRGGDQMDVFMHRGTGWRPEEYDGAINDAIAQLDKKYTQDTTFETVEGFDPYSPLIVVPDDWVGVYRVEYQLSDGLWVDITEPFELDQENHAVRIGWNDSGYMRGRVAKVYGKKQWPELLEDEDTTRVPLGFLQYTVASMLLMSGAHRQVERETENKALFFNQRASEFMEQVGGRLPSNIQWFAQ